jgi:hypothetical protein
MSWPSLPSRERRPMCIAEHMGVGCCRTHVLRRRPQAPSVKHRQRVHSWCATSIHRVWVLLRFKDRVVQIVMQRSLRSQAKLQGKARHLHACYHWKQCACAGMHGHAC